MNKLISIQYLRAFASVFVLITHVLQHLGILFLEKYFLAGAYGVDLFFIISGFLIYITTKDSDSWKDFAFKRFFRIFPLYWFVFLLFFIFSVVFYHSKFSLIEIIQNILMFPWNGELTTQSLLVNVAWSTVYEVYFYIVFMLILAFNLKKKNIILLLVLLFIVMKGAAIINLFHLKESGLFNFVASVAGRSHIVPFIIGIGIAMFYKNEILISWIKKNQVVLKGLFIVTNVFYIFCILSLYSQYKSYLISTLIFCFWLFIDYLFVVNYKSKISLFLSLIGDISFSIYLLHILSILFLIDVLKIESLVIVLLCSLGITIFLSYLTYHFIEKPFIDLAKAIITRRSAVKDIK